jgi:hypothetical protein
MSLRGDPSRRLDISVQYHPENDIIGPSGKPVLKSACRFLRAFEGWHVARVGDFHKPRVRGEAMHQVVTFGRKKAVLCAIKDQRFRRCTRKGLSFKNVCAKALRHVMQVSRNPFLRGLSTR